MVKKVYKDMSLYEKRDFCTKQMETIPNEVKSFPKFEEYTVKLSNELSNLKQKMIAERGTII